MWSEEEEAGPARWRVQGEWGSGTSARTRWGPKQRFTGQLPILNLDVSGYLFGNAVRPSAPLQCSREPFRDVHLRGSPAWAAAMHIRMLLRRRRSCSPGLLIVW